jgi:hypothetical protein
VIQRCTIQNVRFGVWIAGPAQAAKHVPHASGMVIHGNRLSNALKGLDLLGAIADVQVTGNLLWKCQQAGLQVQDLGESSRGLLIANNTVVDSGSGLRFWGNVADPPVPTGVTVCNNVFTRASAGDLLAYVGTKPGMGVTSTALAKALTNQWRFANNWRDLSGVNSQELVPLPPADHYLASFAFKSAQPGDADFMRPTDELFKTMQSAHVSTGAPALPSYAGAVPPADVEPWDWEHYWHSWQRPGLVAKE